MNPSLSLLLAAVSACLLVSQSRGSEEPAVRFCVVGEDGRPLPCRIHLKDGQKKPCYAKDLPRFADHFVCPGTVEIQLPPGEYSFEVERGPEYRRESGTLRVGKGDAKRVERRVQLRRLANLAADGWFSGDLHVHRPVEHIKLLMQAEDLHVAPVITWWGNRNPWKDAQPPAEHLTRFDGDRFFDVMAGEDERQGGALLYFGLSEPLAITGSTGEYPSPMKFLLEARRHPGAWIDIEKPFWWDVPVWLASGQVDSIGLANNHMCRSSMLENEAWGKPRDAVRLPPPRGDGFWSQEIYYHILNCGLRVPPSAGSASGVLPNPVGYDRVYVHVSGEMCYEKWWQGLKAGRSFVTNGPLLLVRADEQLPGHVFTAPEGGKIAVRLDARLMSLDRVPALEIVKNGRVEQRVSPDQFCSGKPATITLDRSGWFLVRAVADVPRTFRFASTAPFYVEIGDTKRLVSRSSVKFFLDWLDERAARLPRKLHDPAQLEEVLQFHRRAKEFWQGLLARANAE
ncbi:MAG: CehA/McbA family metallohydrolase [Thermoguttaceae bacterium]|jgi:hypothetical protein